MDRVKRYVPLTKVSFSEIPEYLHSSKLYKELAENQDQNEMIEVKVLYLNKINNTDELLQLIEIFLYWMLDDYPDFLFEYLIENDLSKEIVKEIKENLYYFDIIGLLLGIFWFKKENNYNGFSNLSFLKYFQKKNNYIWNIETVLYIITSDNLECLEYAHKNGCPWNKKLIENAAFNDNIEMLKYLHENKCPWDYETNFYAARNGHLECLKYAHKHGCPWNEIVTFIAAKKGHLECLKYAHENGCQWHIDTVNIIIRECNSIDSIFNQIFPDDRKNHLECLKYAIDNGCNYDEKAIKILS